MTEQKLSYERDRELFIQWICDRATEAHRCIHDIDDECINRIRIQCNIILTHLDQLVYGDTPDYRLIQHALISTLHTSLDSAELLLQQVRDISYCDYGFTWNTSTASANKAEVLNIQYNKLLSSSPQLYDSILYAKVKQLSHRMLKQVLSLKPELSAGTRKSTLSHTLSTASLPPSTTASSTSISNLVEENTVETSASLEVVTVDAPSQEEMRSEIEDFFSSIAIDSPAAPPIITSAPVTTPVIATVSVVDSSSSSSNALKRSFDVISDQVIGDQSPPVAGLASARSPSISRSRYRVILIFIICL